MPRKFLKKHLPDHNRLSDHKHLKFIGPRLLSHDLWHIHRRSISVGAAVGLFCAYLPIPFESIVAAFAAIWLRANVPLSVGLVFISNPLTWIPLYWPGYLVGTTILGVPALPYEKLTMEWLINEAYVTLFVGCLIVGSILAPVSYVVVQLLWRLHVVSAWRDRRERRRKRKTKRAEEKS